jgi:hypothetical protein
VGLRPGAVQRKVLEVHRHAILAGHRGAGLTVHAERVNLCTRARGMRTVLSIVMDAMALFP